MKKVPKDKPIQGPKVIFDKNMVLDMVKLFGVKGAINRIAGQEFKKKFIKQMVTYVLENKTHEKAILPPEAFH